MKPTEVLFEDANNKLASACQACSASCCKKGLLFMLPEEKRQIDDWILENSPNELEPFHSKLEDCGNFYLFDQEDSCQFLDERNLCRLHDDGVKPTECFIWPAHLYVGNLGDLEVRVSDSCCEGFKFISSTHTVIDSVENLAHHAGYERILDFRRKYAGSYRHLPTRVIDINSPNVKFLDIKELGLYQQKLESLFSQCDRESKMASLQSMLTRYPQGIAVYEVEGEIQGYATLWPLNSAAAAALESGALRESEVDDSHLDPNPAAYPRFWLLEAFAVFERRRPQRRIALLSLLRSVSSRLLPRTAAHRVLAYGINDVSRRFLGRTGFTEPTSRGELPWILDVPTKPF